MASKIDVVAAAVAARRESSVVAVAIFGSCCEIKQIFVAKVYTVRVIRGLAMPILQTIMGLFR